MSKEPELKSVIASFDPNEPPEEIIVAIGDGTIDFDENYPFDARVYFYFHDKREYNTAKSGVYDDNIGFTIIGEVVE